MIHYITSALCVLGLAGVVMNNYRRRECFFVWMVSNSGFVVVDLVYTGLYERALLHGAYTVLAIHGWRQWRRKIG